MVAAIGIAALLAVAFGASSAAAGDGRSPDDVSAPQISEYLPDEVLAAADNDGVTAELADGIVALDRSPIRQDLNNYVWDRERVIVVVHAFGDLKAIASAVGEYLPSGQFEVVIDKYDADELRETADRIARTHVINGQKIAWAGAKADGSGIEVAVVGADHVAARAVEANIAQQFGSEFPIEVIPGEMAVLADRQYHTQPYIGGALISTPNANGSYGVCSSGFSVIQPGVPYSVTGMLFADHCSTTGKVWNSGLYSNSPYFGTAQSTATGGADLKMLRGDVLYYGANFVGAYNSNTAVMVKGYSVPMVNQSICMNGSQSGTVCSNTITHGPLTISVTDLNGNIVATYSNQYRSVQAFNQPAAGNGDSGGPAFRVINDQLHATGILSAIIPGEGGGTSCTGMPSTSSRQCGSVVFTAGLNAFFNNNLSWQILTM
ncbi:MAG: hypothetical protein J0I43_03555 [Microbacterium sp.]|uniref:hypothetical protein n=1 Tax=Microbacterium sp. TaxID=51671 RepID=UPI001AC30E57|nr:hypothetical protein [Microbacterium sp.]MBN9176428.1 hypothetical protein [Microbacterium sp.]